MPAEMPNEPGASGPKPIGRASHLQTPNPYVRVRLERQWDELEQDDDAIARGERIPTEYLDESAVSVVSENDSPDIPFRYSLNPYRGCAHGCAYCYARPTHEYFGLSAGLDFETKVFVKRNAPELFRNWLARDRYVPESVMLSGVTDCYQDAERKFGITRGCLEVALEANQPVSIITKNAAILRDLDLLAPLAARRLTRVAISLTSLDQSLTRSMEPRTSAPEARLRAIRELTDAGVPVMVMTAPIIPGLNEDEVPRLLEAAADAGAKGAGYIFIRLPKSVAPVFEDWLRRVYPNRADKVLERIRASRDGKLNDARFGERMRGGGVWGDQIRATFKLFAQRYGLASHLGPLDTTRFRPPTLPGGQLRLF
ncbi:MAG TPA: radical SAM protein [Planctomycetaceae bacterium]|nr:radical SAM protein [Planctomycetaceae bacterium]HRF02159.1 PA0069 family radical SAM protein [Pirellulaceae bacterium]